MAVFTSAGATLALTAAVPAGAGFIEVGEISDLGDIPSPIHEVVPWRNICDRGEVKAKGGHTYSPQSVTIGADPGDDGQALLDEAITSADPYYVRVAHMGLGVIVGHAFVLGGAMSLGDVNTIVSRQVTLEYRDIQVIPLGGGPGTLVISETNVVLS